MPFSARFLAPHAVRYAIGRMRTISGISRGLCIAPANGPYMNGVLASHYIPFAQPIQLVRTPTRCLRPVSTQDGPATIDASTKVEVHVTLCEAVGQVAVVEHQEQRANNAAERMRGARHCGRTVRARVGRVGRARRDWSVSNGHR